MKFLPAYEYGWQREGGFPATDEEFDICWKECYRKTIDRLEELLKAESTDNDASCMFNALFRLAQIDDSEDNAKLCVNYLKKLHEKYMLDRM